MTVRPFDFARTVTPPRQERVAGSAQGGRQVREEAYLAERKTDANQASARDDIEARRPRPDIRPAAPDIRHAPNRLSFLGETPLQNAPEFA